MMVETDSAEEVFHNLCGLSCALVDPVRPSYDMSELIKARVSGGYESTPGDGHGALDDCMSYSFSLCEFCLDWLFTQFKVPVSQWNMTTGRDEQEEREPAHVRVAKDDWRKMKKEFCVEAECRAILRSK